MSGKRKNDTIFDSQKVNENLIWAEVETNFFQTTSKQNSGNVFFHYYWRNLSSVPHEETLTNEVTLNATKTNIFQENLENQK